ncbi:hypothetical protein V1278_001981 [Bradyrhizobium sp. AZCC 1577]
MVDNLVAELKQKYEEDFLARAAAARLTDGNKTVA